MNLDQVAAASLAYANEIADRTPADPADDPHNVKNSDYSANHHVISATPDDEHRFIAMLVKAMNDDTVVAAGFHDDQLRDSHGRWTDSPDFPLSKQRADRMWQQITDAKPLTPPQRQAVTDYTGFAYEPINEFLRNPKNVVAEPKDLTTAGHLLDALRPTLHPMTVLRGTTPDQLGVKSAGMNKEQTFAALQKKVGKTFNERGFMSTTTMPSALEDLEHSIVLEIDVPPRSLHINARSMSVTPEEHEVILAPGKYEVVSVRRPTSHDAQDVDLTYTSAIVRVRLVK